MADPFDLPHRAARCVEHASQGNPVILLVTDEEKTVARELVGGAPVIVADGREALAFLRQWVREAFEDVPKKRIRKR